MACIGCAYGPHPDPGLPLGALGRGSGAFISFWWTGIRDIDTRGLFAAGQADAERILSGAWWRVITALTLHAHWGHLFGNAVAMLVFGGAVCRWLGGGVGIGLIFATGVLGNLATAIYHGDAHFSVGASTATFGALEFWGAYRCVGTGWRIRGALPAGRPSALRPRALACLPCWGSVTGRILRPMPLASGGGRPWCGPGSVDRPRERLVCPGSRGGFHPRKHDGRLGPGIERLKGGPCGSGGLFPGAMLSVAFNDSKRSRSSGTSRVRLARCGAPGQPRTANPAQQHRLAAGQRLCCLQATACAVYRPQRPENG